GNEPTRRSLHHNMVLWGDGSGSRARLLHAGRQQVGERGIELILPESGADGASQLGEPVCEATERPASPLAGRLLGGCDAAAGLGREPLQAMPELRRELARRRRAEGGVEAVQAAVDAREP